MCGKLSDGIIGKTVVISDEIQGIIKKHEKDEIQRDVIRVKITKGRTAVTDYFLDDVKLK